MAVLGLREARLANARVEAEIADDLRSESKRRMPPDRRRERRRSVHVHAREPSSAAGWQASAAPARLARARGRGPHRGSRPGADRPRPRVARPRAASYRRASDGLGGRRDPLAAGGRGYAPEPTSFFARRAGAQQPLPAVDEPAQRPCLLVRAPHLLEEIRRAAWPGCGRRVYQSWPWRGDQLEPAGVGTTTQATSGSIIRAIYVAPIVGLERLVLRTQARRAQLKRLRSRLDRPRRALPRRPRRSHLAVVAVDVYLQ